jgi:hypothetical protein
MSYELYGGEKPSRHGPLARKVKEFLAQRRQARTGYIRLSEKGQTFNEKRPEAVSCAFPFLFRVTETEEPAL